MKKSFILGEYLPRTTELKVLWEVPPPHWTGVSSYSLNTGNLRFRIRNFTSLSPAYRLNGVTRTLFAQGTSEFGNVCGIDGDFVNCGYGNFVSGFDEETRVLNYTELLEKHDLSSLSADPLYETLGEEYLATNAVAYVIFTQGENSRGFYEVQLNGGNYEWVLTEREQSITFDTKFWTDEDLEITLVDYGLDNSQTTYEDVGFQSFVLSNYLPRTTALKVLWELPPPSWVFASGSTHLLRTENDRFGILMTSSTPAGYRLNGVDKTFWTSEGGFQDVCGIDGNSSCGYVNLISGFDEETSILNYTALLAKYDLTALSENPLYETLGEEFAETNALVYLTQNEGSNFKGFYEVQLNNDTYEWVFVRKEQSITVTKI